MSDIEKWKSAPRRRCQIPGGLPSLVAQNLIPDLISSFVPPDTPPDAILEFVVTVNDREMPTREFAEYVALIDRLYGRLSPGGLRSYSRREGRLTIAECRKSELVNQEPALKQLDDARKGQLTKLLEALLAEENRHLLGPIRLCQK